MYSFWILREYAMYGIQGVTQSKSVVLSNISRILLILWHALCIGGAVQRPELVGGCVPVTDEERVDILYKPQEDEWGGRRREEECARIIAGIDQLITVGMYVCKRSWMNSPLYLCRDLCGNNAKC